MVKQDIAVWDCSFVTMSVKLGDPSLQYVLWRHAMCQGRWKPCFGPDKQFWIACYRGEGKNLVCRQPKRRSVAKTSFSVDLLDRFMGPSERWIGEVGGLAVWNVMPDLTSKHWSNLFKTSKMEKHSFSISIRAYRCSIAVRLLEL